MKEKKKELEAHGPEEGKESRGSRFLGWDDKEKDYVVATDGWILHKPGWTGEMKQRRENGNRKTKGKN